MVQKMEELAAAMPSFLGIESARDGLGINVSYWDSLAAISHWRRQAEHRVAQQRGYEVWYESFKLRNSLVERDYGFDRLT